MSHLSKGKIDLLLQQTISLIVTSDKLVVKSGRGSCK